MGRPNPPPPSKPVLEDIPEDIYRDHIGVTPQRQPGLSAVGASVLRGRLSGDQLLALADLADSSATATSAPPSPRTSSSPTSPTSASSTSSPSSKPSTSTSTSAPSGAAPSPAPAPSSASSPSPKPSPSQAGSSPRWKSRLPTFDQQIKLHVTGCTNSCGQHWIADIGLEGKKIKQNGVLTDAFFFCVGGSLGKHAQPARPIGYRAAADDVPDSIERLLRAYLTARQPEEDLRAWFTRTDTETLRGHLAATPVSRLPAPETRDPAPGGFHHAADA